VIDVAVVEETGSGTVVGCVVGIGPFSFGFHVTTQPEAARGRLAWRLARDRPTTCSRTAGDTVKWMPTPHGSIVIYAMAARTLLPAFLIRGAERNGLIATLYAVRARAEQID
jgi:hypothetical protein